MRTRARSVIPAALLLWAAGLMAVVESSPSQAAGAQGGGRIWEGVYTPAQAERGKATVTRVCVFCHNFDLTGLRGPALKGDEFMKTWQDETVYRLFSTIRDTMPPSGTVETLSDQAKIDVVAYILQINGFPAGESELTQTEADLEQMQIARNDRSGPREIQNFSLVQVIGCLTARPDGSWVLTETTEPVTTREVEGTGRVSADLAAMPPGTGTYELQSIRRFNPEAQRNQRMEARGLLYRAPGDNSLNLTSLRVVADACR